MAECKLEGLEAAFVGMAPIPIKTGIAHCKGKHLLRSGVPKLAAAAVRFIGKGLVLHGLPSPDYCVSD